MRLFLVAQLVFIYFYFLSHGAHLVLVRRGVFVVFLCVDAAIIVAFALVAIVFAVVCFFVCVRSFEC